MENNNRTKLCIFLQKSDNYQNVQNTFSNTNSYGIAQHINEFKVK